MIVSILSIATVALIGLWLHACYDARQLRVQVSVLKAENEALYQLKEWK